MTPGAAEGPSVGLVLGGGLPPEDVPATARLAEELGFREVWYAEDYFFSGGMTGAAATLGATTTIPVGLGVVSALVRHPAVLAMEIATLCRLHPGRVRAGIGLGVIDRLHQMGLGPRATLRETEACTGTLRCLLDGGETPAEATLGGITLSHPPGERVPLYLGAMGPKMLRLAGAIADGTLLSWIKSRNYVRWARGQIAAGAREAGRAGRPRIVSFAIFSADSDRQKAKHAVRGAVVRELARPCSRAEPGRRSSQSCPSAGSTTSRSPEVRTSVPPGSARTSRPAPIRLPSSHSLPIAAPSSSGSRGARCCLA